MAIYNIDEPHFEIKCYKFVLIITEKRLNIPKFNVITLIKQFVRLVKFINILLS